MAWFRLARALTSALAMLLPACTLWALMLPNASSPGDAADGARIPNPAKAPVSMLGPADVLVYADPGFAGTIGYWMVICGTAAVLMVLAAACVPNPPTSYWSARGRTLAVWGLCSLLLGFVFAAPWFYGLFRLMTRA